MSWFDFCLGVGVLAIIPFALAAYGGHVAAETINDAHQRRSVKLKFWGMCFIGVAIAVVYQYRITKSDAEKQKSMQDWQHGIAEKLDEIIKNPVSQEQQQAAIKLKHEAANPSASKSPRLGRGPDAYKDLDDAQVGQWAMEEADKIEDLANHAMEHNEFESFGSRMWRFTSKFKDCCTQDVTELRNEILRRLGPPAKDPDEIQAWTILFPEVKYPIATDTVNPALVRDYAPYLRRLGLHLKRRAIPRPAPLALQFSEQQLPPEQPGYSRIVVSIETKKKLSSGFIAVQFAGQPYRAGCDFGDSKLPLLSLNFIDNQTVVELLKATTNYVLQIDKTPLEPGKVVHVEARATSPIHVSAVTYFEE